MTRPDDAICGECGDWQADYPEMAIEPGEIPACWGMCTNLLGQPPVGSWRRQTWWTTDPCPAWIARTYPPRSMENERA